MGHRPQAGRRRGRLAGSYDTVSAATTIVPPYTVNATNGVRYTRQLTASGRVALSWSANTAPLRTAAYPLVPGLYLTNATGRIGGIPTQIGTSNVTITVWEFGNNTGGKVSAGFTNIVLNSTNCVLTIPAAQLVHSGIYTVVVTNAANSNGIVSSNALVNVTAGSANTPPLLNPIIDQLVLVGDTLTLRAQATDDDTPAQTLTYNLLPGAPPSAAIHPSSGLLTWPTSGLPAPHINTFGIRVTDSGSPSLSATQSCRVVVTANHAPVLENVPDLTADVLGMVHYTFVAADADLPLDDLRFSLGPNAPQGARIHPLTGVFLWRPSREQASSTNFIVVLAADDGVPPRSDSRTLKVVVDDYAELYASQRELLVGDAVAMPIIVRSSTPLSNLTFNVEFRAHFTNFAVESSDGTATLTFVESNRVGLRLTSPSPQPPRGDTFAYLLFTVAADQPSAFVPMEFTQLVVERPGGASVNRLLTTPGRVVAVGSTPLMEGFINAPYGLIHGRPGEFQIIETATTLLNGGNWSQIATRTQGPLTDAIFLGNYLGTNRPPTLFFRARPADAGQQEERGRQNP